VISYYEAALKSAVSIAQVVDLDGEFLGLYSRVSNPDRVIVYVPGGVKCLGLSTPAGTMQPNGFTWKWLPLWLHCGAAVAVIDMPPCFYESDMTPRERIKDQRREAIIKAVEYLRQRFPSSDIVGYGHSYGSLEISQLLSQDGVLDAAIVGSGTWGVDQDRDQEDFDICAGDLDPGAIKIPVLIVHHANDQTPKCLYTDVTEIMNKFDSIRVSGGMPHMGNPGLEPGPHFFHMQENEVVKNIVQWLRKKEYSKFIL